MVMMDPQAVAALPLWRSGLLLTGGTVIGAMIVELTARKLIPHQVRGGAQHRRVRGVHGRRNDLRRSSSLCRYAGARGLQQAEAVTGHEASLVEDVFQLLSGLSGPGPAVMRQDIVAYTRHVVADELPAQARGQSVPVQLPALQRLTQGALHTRPDDSAGSSGG